MVMLSISEWAANFDVTARPWLILGKGPSYAYIREICQTAYHICSLNHVVRELPVTLAHVIDLDVVRDCADAIVLNGRYLVMPWHPHVKFRASPKTLMEYIPEIPVLQRLEAEGRLLCYNATTAGRYTPYPGAPHVKVRFFSAEAALNVLVACGARTVRSLGVDGGNSYSHAFGDLHGRTLLRNGRESFDAQFQTIAETIRRSGILYAPLYMEAPARVFVGTDQTQMLACRVLEFSIKKHASMTVEVTPIDNAGLPVPKDATRQARTGFSFCRFKIPALCNFSGRGIYLDADMLVLADIADLWSRPFEGADLLFAEQSSAQGRLPQYSVLVLNCSNLQWDAQDIVSGLDQGRYDYTQLMHEFCILPPERKRALLPSEWNSLEHYEPGTTRLLHYTDMPNQPWVSDRNPNRKLWFSYLREAISEGFISEDFLYEEIARGHVAPALPRWIRLREPSNMNRLMANWTPPYRRFSKSVKTSREPDPETADIGNQSHLFSKIAGRLRHIVNARHWMSRTSMLQSSATRIKVPMSARPFSHSAPFADSEAERVPLVHVFRQAALNWISTQRTSSSTMVAAECGIYKGHAVIACAKIAQDLGIPLRLFALDSFSGLPELSEADLRLAPQKARYRYTTLFADVSLAEVERRCAENRVSSSVILVPGLFSHTLPALPEQKYHFINIDCDLFEPHLECLEYFYPRMCQGGVIFFDDYHSADFPMAREAIDNFMSSKPERLFHLRYGPDGVNGTKCFFIKY
jgi:hypothetical protein